MRGVTAILCAAAAASACGKDTQLADAQNQIDARSADANTGPDADPHGPVTVTVLDYNGTGAPAPGVTVVFLEPDGTVEKEVATDANGKASANVLAGASVTAVYVVSAGQHALETINGVEPNDDLTIGSGSDSSDAGTFTVNLIDTIGTTRYEVYGPCGVGTYIFNPKQGHGPNGVVATIPVTLTMKKDCLQSTMDLVAVRYDVDFVASEYVELEDVPFVDAGHVDQAAAWTAVPLVAVSETNIPADITNVNVTGIVPDGAGFAYGAPLTPAAGGVNANFPLPVAKTALYISSLSSSDHTGTQTIFETHDGTKSDYTLDYGGNILTWIDPPVLDPATGMITTATSGTGNADGFGVTVYFDHDAGVTYSWTVWSANVGTIQLPTLPTDLADDFPKNGDILSSNTAIVFDLDAATSYDDVRAHLDSGLGAYYDGRGTVGKLRVSVSNNPASRRK
ncbi:MAG TPA: hypothetical protein VL463_32910 [Kofleriaceae bacterium]|jgi:hypothetical protein|nr:hypothetical protein [Kofleriaceae bacterium]